MVPVLASYPSQAVDRRAEGEGICSSENMKSKNGKANPSGSMYSLLPQCICWFALCISRHRVYIRAIHPFLFLKFISFLSPCCDLLSLPTAAELSVHHQVFIFFSSLLWLLSWTLDTNACGSDAETSVGRYHKLPVLEVFFLYFIHLERRDQIIMPRSGNYPFLRRLVLLKAPLLWTGWHREVYFHKHLKVGW